MAFTPTNEVVAIRQTSSVAFNGSPCGVGAVLFEPFLNPTTGVVEYVRPTDISDAAATAGGEFVFSETVVIREIRGACGNISVVICDADDSHAVTMTTSPSPITTNAQLNNIAVQRSQKLKITSSTAGWVEVYVVKRIYN